VLYGPDNYNHLVFQTLFSGATAKQKGETENTSFARFDRGTRLIEIEEKKHQGPYLKYRLPHSAYERRAMHIKILLNSSSIAGGHGAKFKTMT